MPEFIILIYPLLQRQHPIRNKVEGSEMHDAHFEDAVMAGIFKVMFLWMFVMHEIFSLFAQCIWQFF